jgi:hypothetical protein
MPAFPQFIDFEASSLNAESYPIEVAWSAPDGSIESHLISPAEISVWTDWSAEAEAVHGISREQLLSDGQTPAYVCSRLRIAAERGVLYSDCPYFDDDWLVKLCLAAGTTRAGIVLGDTAQLSPISAILDTPAYHALAEQARALAGPAHRAANDVRFLWELYRLATEIAR